MPGRDADDLATRVSVIIPVRDDPRILDCVASVLACADERAALEVIVVGHRSAAQFSRDVLAHLPACARVIRFEGETVYGARNAGVAAASGEALLFVDADCVVRPGWIAEALRGLARGADLVQGFSGSLGRSRADALVQRRYAAHLSRVRAGDGTECDTRNLAVRRRVFDSVMFPGGWRRTGDTYLGLVAEAKGFRVAYWPPMRVDHAHDRDLAVFAGKQVCHGWGAQRLMREHPAVAWHGGHLGLVGRLVRLAGQLPGAALAGNVLARAAVRSASLTDSMLPVLPAPVSGLAMLCLDKCSALAGHLLFEAGEPEPQLSSILRRPDVHG